MQLLIKNITVLHPGSPHHRQTVDIFIQKGQITEIASGLQKIRVQEIDGANLMALPGLFDLGTTIGDPGLEHREDLRSATQAALQGGFTGLACLPNTSPSLHSKSEITYVRNFSKGNPVDILPMGAVSEDCAGKDLTEIYDMFASGAVAFTDGKNPIQNSGLMLRALLYVLPFDGIVINQPLDKSIAPGGQMHEGIVSTSLGMKGIPALAEELMLKRDIFLAEYSGSRLHILNVSTAGAVDLIKRAKAKGLKISASASVMNLVCDDSMVEGFDSNYKVMPPLRGREDMKALKAGLKDGTIDFITTNHSPLDEEAKNLEFPYAEFGAIGLESSFALSHTFLSKNFDLEKLVEQWAIAPRVLLKLPIPEIAKGAAANLCIFDPNEEWTFSTEDIASKSKNTPFIGWKLKGQIKAVIKDNHLFIRQNL